MVAFLGVAADRRLLDEDLVNLPDAEQHREPVDLDSASTTGSSRRDRSLTGVTLIGGGGAGALRRLAASVRRRRRVRRRPRRDRNPAGGHPLGMGARRRVRRPDASTSASNGRPTNAAGLARRRLSRIRASASRPACSTTPRHGSNASCTSRSSPPQHTFTFVRETRRRGDVRRRHLGRGHRHRCRDDAPPGPARDRPSPRTLGSRVDRLRRGAAQRRRRPTATGRAAGRGHRAVRTHQRVAARTPTGRIVDRDGDQRSSETSDAGGLVGP